MTFEQIVLAIIELFKGINSFLEWLFTVFQF